MSWPPKHRGALGLIGLLPLLASLPPELLDQIRASKDKEAERRERQRLEDLASGSTDALVLRLPADPIERIVPPPEWKGRKKKTRRQRKKELARR